jgi:phospholipid/cholesterol/gamma-HCH transport system substrate-binding protein
MEQPNARGRNNFVVGFFVFVSLLVLAGFVVFMGGSSPFSRDVKVKAFFRDVRGLNVGAPVFYSGIQVGRVSGYQFPTPEEAAVPGQEAGVFVQLSLFREHKTRVRADSVATITTQGVLGDKVIVFIPGQDTKAVTPGATVQSEQPKELGDYFKKGGAIVEDLSGVAHNLNEILAAVNNSGRLERILVNFEKASIGLAATAKTVDGISKDDLPAVMASVRKILTKIERGDGTLGALINDPSLHEDLRLLVGGAQRSKMVRFLIRQAISSGEAGSVPPPTKAPPQKSH